MSLEKFVSELEAALDLPDVKLAPETEFKTLAGWDSLCVLNTIAMIDEVHGVTVTGRQIDAATTVADLYATASKLKA